MNDGMCTCCSCCPAQEGSDYCEDCEKMLEESPPDDWTEVEETEFIRGDKLIW